MSNTRNLRQLFLCAAFVSLAAGGPACADDFHNKNLLVGDRAVGLGGGYAAISDDPSGMYYNPAGILTAGDLSSASVNVYARSSTTYKNFFADGRSFTDTSSTIVPSFFGILRHYSFGTLGLSVAVPDFLSESQTNGGPYSQVVTFNPGTTSAINETATGNSQFSTDIDQAAYQLGLSFAAPLTPRISAGATLYGTYHNARNARQVDDQYAVADAANGVSGNFIAFSSYRTTEDIFGVMPKFGLKAEAAPGLTLGLVVAKEFAASRTYQVNSITSFSGNYTDNGSTVIIPDSHQDLETKTSSLRHYPWQVTGSGAYHFTPTLLGLLQLDFFTGAVGDTSGDINNGTFRTRPVLNWTVGGEWEIKPGLSVRMSAYSSRSNLGDLVANSFERQEAINLYGGSLGATYRTPAHVYQAGFYTTAGTGHGNPGSLNAGESNQGFSFRLDRISQMNVSAYFGVTI